MRIDRVIKSEDNIYSVETMEYMEFDEDPGRLDDRSCPIEETPLQKMIGVQEEIDRLLREAKDKAKGIIQKANLKTHKIREEALQSGYEDGRKEAIVEMQKTLDSISNVFKKGLEDLACLKDNILSETESDIVRLTIAIAKKLACKELEQHPESIVSVVKEAIKSVKNEDKIVVKVHPDDHRALENHFSDLIELVSETSKLKLEEDTGLNTGDCIVVTDTNLIDMSLEARMESIDQLLTN